MERVGLSNLIESIQRIKFKLNVFAGSGFEADFTYDEICI